MIKAKSTLLNTIFTFVFLIVLTIVGCQNVMAAQPSSIGPVVVGQTVGGSTYFPIKTADNYNVLCTSGINVAVPSQRTCSLITNGQWSESTQAGVAAIISEYNSGNIKGSYNSYWYAEVAINSYLKYGSVSVNAESDSLVKSLVAKAQTASKKASTTFTLSLSADSLTFTKSGDYYISNAITVKDTGGYMDSFNVSVSGTSGVEVVNKTNNSFKVRFPASNVTVGKSVTINAKVTGTKSYNVAKNYSCGSGVQNVTIDYVESKTVTADKSISGTITRKGNNVEISKTDATTGKELSGATLVVKKSSGEQIDKWVSTTTPHKISNLEAGTYTLTETIAPEGYKLSTKTVSFTVKENGTTTKVKMENEPLKTGALISKQDISNKKELPGATLVIKDEKGSEITRWVSTNEPKYIELTPGKYTLAETITPKGYKLSTETIEFEVKKDGTTTKVVMYNEQNKTGVIISKQDITTKKELPGATLVIKDSNGNEITSWVSGTEPRYIELEPGDYTLTETIAPDGYDLSYEVIKFTVDSEGNATTDIIMYNSKTPVTADKNILLTVVGLISAGVIGAVAIKKIKHQM